MFKRNQEKIVAKKIEKAFEKIAQEQGVSVEEVKKEISYAINVGMSNDDPKVKEQWNKMPRKSDVPTPEEVIAWAITKLDTRVAH